MQTAKTSKTTAVYLRVSTSRQDTESQEPDIRRWLAAQDPADLGEVKWYRDKFTGRTMDRPGMKRLMRAIEAGEVGQVVVWRLDRLGRTTKGLVSLFDTLQAKGVNLVSLRDGLDLTTPAGRMLSTILASIAAYESEVKSERVKAGMAVAKASGKPVGGCPEGRRLKVKPEQEAAVLDLFKRSVPIAAIARTVGLSRPTIYRVLRWNGLEVRTLAGTRTTATTSPARF